VCSTVWTPSIHMYGYHQDHACVMAKNKLTLHKQRKISPSTTENCPSAHVNGHPATVTIARSRPVTSRGRAGTALLPPPSPMIVDPVCP
jgi:hypothetical protein